MSLSPWQLRLAAHVVAEELARRRRSGQPIPPPLLDLDRALRNQLAANGHENGVAPTEPVTLETVNQRAERLGISPRTVRRYARQAGAKRAGRTWIFEN